MTTFVRQLDEKSIVSLIKRLKNHQIPSKNPYLRFAAKVDKTSLSIYTSGKLVLQGKGYEELALNLGLVQEADRGEQGVSNQLDLIGSDEVGNGSYFGGIAVVASFVKVSDHAWLKRLGVDDSKNLTDPNIRQLAPILEEKIPHKALLLSPQKYNEVVGTGKRHNAVSVKVALHNQAIFLLLQTDLEPQEIVIDAFTSQNNYEKYLKAEKNHFKNPLTFVQKAESQYLAVAVSSIIARNLFLENLADLGRDLGFNLPSGAGTKSDQVASQILAAYGQAGLDKTAKVHFKNTQKAYQLLKK